jgi:inner membrane protein
MDSITHTVLGACTGELIAGKKMGKQAMLWGALANNLPDIDVFTTYWMSHADSLLAHRGFTHSILFTLAAPPLLAFLFRKIFSKGKATFMDWFWIFFTGCLIHIFIDAMTCYGTGWYLPFSKERVSFNVLFVADPFYTVGLLVCTIGLLFLRKNLPKRKKWAWTGIALSTVYLLYAVTNKISIHSHTKEELNRQKIAYEDYITTPTPLNNFLWYLVARNDTGYYIGYRSVFDDGEEIDFNFYRKNEQLLASVPQDKDLFTLKRFADDYYSVEKKGDSLFFNDLRFGQIDGWNLEQAPFVFRYQIGENANNDLVIQKGRIAASGGDAMEKLIDRIKGE